MFADPDEINPGLIGQNRLVQQIADHLRMAVQAATGAGGDIAKSIKTKFNRVGHRRGSLKDAGNLGAVAGLCNGTRRAWLR